MLTGINLGLFRDRDRGLRLPRLVREAGAVDGLARLRLSSIEVNHVSEELVAALRETPTVASTSTCRSSPATTACWRRWAGATRVATYLRRLEPLADVNLTADVIVGFPGEDDAAFERTLRAVDDGGITKVHVFPYSPRPGTRTAAADTVPAAVKKERSARLRARSDDACRRHWESKLGAEDIVLVDRPGRGYGDDYTPVARRRARRVARARARQRGHRGGRRAA